MKNIDMDKKIMSLYCDIWANEKFAKALEYSEHIEELDRKLAKTDICYKKRMKKVLKSMPTANKFIMLERSVAEDMLDVLSPNDKADIAAELTKIVSEFELSDILYLDAAKSFIIDFRYKLHNLGKRKTGVGATCVKFVKFGYKGHGHGPIRDTYNH